MGYTEQKSSFKLCLLGRSYELQSHQSETLCHSFTGALLKTLHCVLPTTVYLCNPFTIEVCIQKGTNAVKETGASSKFFPPVSDFPVLIPYMKNVYNKLSSAALLIQNDIILYLLSA